MGVKLLGKIKIHEIAKKVGLASKEVIEKARELGIAVTSHLSTIENEQAEKLEQALDDGKTKNIGKKEKKVKEKETDTPVIIRRELIITDEDKKKEKQEEKNSQNRKDVGFVEREKNQNYNIVYRNKPTKPLTVNELFGIKDSKKEEQKKEEVKEVKEQSKEQAKEQAKEEMLEKETIKAQENAPTPKVQTSSTTTVESPKPEQRRTQNLLLQRKNAQSISLCDSYQKEVHNLLHNQFLYIPSEVHSVYVFRTPQQPKPIRNIQS